MGKVYDVAAKTSEKVPDGVLIDGMTFRVNRSGKAMKRVMTLDMGDEDTPDEEKAELSVGVVYKSLSYLLVGDEGVHPESDWLEERVDFEIASDLLTELMPKGEEIPPVPEPDGPSTPGSGESH